MGYLIPPGSGKREHLRLSAQLQSPFNLQGDVDDDTEFVAIGQALLGPYVGTFRRLQEKASKHLVTAITPIHVWLQTKRTPEVRAVADVKNSALIAALTTLLRWPDRLQAKCYIEGFRIVGPIESSHKSKLRKVSTVSRPKQTFIHTCVPGHRSITEKSSRQRSLSNSADGQVLFERQMTSIKSLERACGVSFRASCCSNAFVIGSSTMPRKENKIALHSALKRCLRSPLIGLVKHLNVWRLCLQSDAQNALSLEFRLLTSQTPSKVAQCTQPTSEPALLLVV